jgi:acetyl esterase/lipase
VVILRLSAPSHSADSSSGAGEVGGAAAPFRPRLSTSLKDRTRSIVLLSIVLEVPLLGRAARGLTREPRIETLEIDGVPVEIVRPARDGPWPAFLFVNGAHPLRRDEPVVQRLSRGLARAGFVVIVPDLPGLGEGAITTRLPEALAAVTRHAIDLPDVRGGRVALVGASTGASLAIIAAAQPEFAGRISVVAAVAPYANLEKMICLTTTGFYEEEAGFVRYEVSDLSRRVVARSLVASLDCEDREELLAELSRLELDEVDPLEALPARADLSPKARLVARLLGNRDPARFAALCAELPPEIGPLMAQLSPVATAGGVSAAVEVVVPPADEYFPSGEAAALAGALPNVRLTVSHVLDHTRPSLSLATLGDFADFNRFVVRSLAVAGA